MGTENTPFAFGKNWASYAQTIGETEIEAAKDGLARLIPPADLAGKSFLDIGSGSGLHSLAAHLLGAKPIRAVDIDPDSAQTTKAVLERFNVPADVSETSVFDLPQDQFDTVYSWGVLHHTGDMWRAIDKAASLVKPGGLLAIALYQATPADRFWVAEKRWYSSAPSWAQRLARAVYRLAFRVLCRRVTDQSYSSLIAGYKARGMDHAHDIHDWLGGWPYETARPSDVRQRLEARGFILERESLFKIRARGILGSACDEYVFRAR